MQLRRALIAFVLVFAAVTVVAAISAPSEEDDSSPPSSPAPRASASNAITVAFRHPLEGPPPVRPVRNGSHVVVRVEAGVAGNVEIPGLGLIEPVAPGAPAVFDVLATRSGRYDVILLPVTGDRTKLGALAVEN